MGEALGSSSEPGCPHLSRRSTATAPQAPAAAAGLSLVPRSGGVAVSEATRPGAAGGRTRWWGEGGQGESCGRARRPGRARALEAAPEARLVIPGLRLARKVCERSGGAARTCSFIGRAGTRASPVTSRPPRWVEAGGSPERGYYPQTTHGCQTPHLLGP